MFRKKQKYILKIKTRGGKNIVQRILDPLSNVSKKKEDFST